LNSSIRNIYNTVIVNTSFFTTPSAITILLQCPNSATTIQLLEIFIDVSTLILNTSTTITNMIGIKYQNNNFNDYNDCDTLSLPYINSQYYFYNGNNVSVFDFLYINNIFANGAGSFNSNFYNFQAFDDTGLNLVSPKGKNIVIQNNNYISDISGYMTFHIIGKSLSF
jgi:hypothetical protein